MRTALQAAAVVALLMISGCGAGPTSPAGDPTTAQPTTAEPTADDPTPTSTTRIE